MSIKKNKDKSLKTIPNNEIAPSSQDSNWELYEKKISPMGNNFELHVTKDTVSIQDEGGEVFSAKIPIPEGASRTIAKVNGANLKIQFKDE